MSYVHKRDRVFYPAGDAEQISPRPRTAGRIKTMLSCTDTRAWQLDKEGRRQHLLEILNNPGKKVNFLFVLLITPFNPNICFFLFSFVE